MQLGEEKQAEQHNKGKSKHQQNNIGQYNAALI